MEDEERNAGREDRRFLAKLAAAILQLRSKETV
jgi:hypothetical protein